MKILVLSLLRMGDVLLHHEILRSIRRSHPNSHISCLINDGSQAVTELIPEVDEWIIFARDHWQRQMNQSQRWIFAPVLQLEKLLRKLQTDQYDQIVNLTHTVLSGHIAGFLSSQALDIRGLCLNHQGGMEGTKTLPKYRKSLSYLNDVWSQEKAPLLHYVEALSFATGYELDLHVESTHRGSSNKILSFQLNTSDTRKHFAPEQWSKTLQTVQNHFPEFEIQILTAPHEQNSWELLLQNLQKVQIIPCSLLEGIQLIRNSDVFISHDTSLLHLAARTQTPIVQISLGPSHIYKTSSLQNGAVVLAAQKSCFPCGHQEKCSRPSLECHEDIGAQDVVEAIQFQLSEQRHRLPSRLSMVQIVDGLWWLQNGKKDRNFSQKLTLHTHLSGHLDSEQVSKEARLESKSSNPFDATIR